MDASGSLPLEGGERRPTFFFYVKKELGLVLDLLSLFIPLLGWFLVIMFSLTDEMALSMLPHVNWTGKLLIIGIFVCMLFGLLAGAAALIFHFIQVQPSLLRCLFGLLVITVNIVNFIGYWCLQMIFVADKSGYLAPR